MTIETPASQTNQLLAIQSKIYESTHRDAEVFKREYFMSSLMKAAFRVILKHVRRNEYSISQGHQVIVDLAYVSDLLNEIVDAEDESTVSGFYHLIAKSVNQNTRDGDSALKADRIAQIVQKKRSTVRLYN